MATSAGLGGAYVGCSLPQSEGASKQATPEAAGRMPVVYISHGSPMVGIETNPYTAALRRMGESLPTPKAIVIVSAHWEAPAPIRVTGSEAPQLIYDFYGFPKELHALLYPCPGKPELAAEIVTLLSEAGLKAQLDPKRGLDHGAWIPMKLAYPAADIPILEVTLSVPRRPEEILKIGKALAPLRGKGVLLVGSGGIVHNLGRLRWDDQDAPIDPWAKEFDGWVRERLDKGDVAGLLRYRDDGPNANLAVPTTEHFDPLFFALGASSQSDRPLDIYEGFHYGNLSMRTFALR